MMEEIRAPLKMPAGEATGMFVNEWKNGRTYLVYKDNDRRDLGNYRLISILPIINRVYEKKVFNQLYPYPKDNSILSKFQSGFRPFHSTVCFNSNVRQLV